jgi:uncharacterized protein YbjT (DUF2867 family)
MERSALLAGATGLVGRALLPLLLERHAAVHLLLRRDAHRLPQDPKLQRHVVDFAQMPALPPLDDGYCCLGTTIVAAGSPEAFRAVDFDAVLATARAAHAAGATRFGVVSALGADPASTIFYNRVKGEMEAALRTLGFRTLVIARPSLLIGDRAALGQAPRRAEQWAQRWLQPVAALIPARWRPIAAETVARGLLRAVNESRPGTRIVESAELQVLGR